MSILERICEWVRNSTITAKVTGLAGQRNSARAGRETDRNEAPSTTSASSTSSASSVRESLPGPGTGQPSDCQDRETVPDTVIAGPAGRTEESSGIQGVLGRKPGSDRVSREDHDPWTVTVHPASRFEKVGRIVRDHGDLILRSDLDARGFFIAEEDVRKALAGGTGEVWLLDSPGQVGTVCLSVSGRALNMTIDGDLHTVPLRNLLPVIEGKRRKAALFKGV